MINRYLHVIYCDDVRNELGNKTSLIGIYGGDLFVNKIPAIIPQLCIVLSVVSDSSDPIQSLTITVTRDEQQLAEISPTADDLSKGRRLAQASRPAGAAMGVSTIGMVFKIAPLAIDGPAVIRVRAQTEREELRAAALRLDVSPAASQRTAAAASTAAVPSEAPLH